MIIEDILFQDFSGVSSTHYAPIVGTLVCSSEDVSLHLNLTANVQDMRNSAKLTPRTQVCPDIVAKDVNITTPNGAKAEWTCTNVDESLLAINCI